MSATAMGDGVAGASLLPAARLLQEVWVSSAVGALLACALVAAWWALTPVMRFWWGSRQLGARVLDALGVGRPSAQEAQEALMTFPTEKEGRLGRFSTSMAAAEMLQLSVVVVALNEEARLAIMLDDALAFLGARRDRDPGFSFEVVVVDNGSSDFTASSVLRFTHKFGSQTVRLLRLRRREGPGEALALGVMRARGRRILVADAQGAVRLQELERLESAMQLLQRSHRGRARDRAAGDARAGGRLEPEPEAAVEPEPDCDCVVIGSRAHLQLELVRKSGLAVGGLAAGKSESDAGVEAGSVAGPPAAAVTRLQGFAWRASAALFRLLCVPDVYDAQCRFRLFSRRAARRLLACHLLETRGVDAELVFLAALTQTPLAETGVRWSALEAACVCSAAESAALARDVLAMRLCYATTGLWKTKVA